MWILFLYFNSVVSALEPDASSDKKRPIIIFQGKHIKTPFLNSIFYSG